MLLDPHHQLLCTECASPCGGAGSVLSLLGRGTEWEARCRGEAAFVSCRKSRANDVSLPLE